MGSGMTVVQSFSGPVPHLKALAAKRLIFNQEGLQFYKNRHLEFYALIPISLAEFGQGEVHILFENKGHPPPLDYFAVGLVVVGIAIALLVIPVSRPITRRINQLRQSTMRIAEGDLSHRVATSGKDEIAELGISFNQMAAKLESMITNSKELTANISHELRTPLARIRVSEELLREKIIHAGLPVLTRHLDEICEDVNTLDTLVGRILELSKLEMRLRRWCLNHWTWQP